MSSENFTIRQGDRLPVLRARAYDEDAAVDLTAFASISFRMVNSAGLEVTGTATGDASGNLSYAWADGDTDTAGDYLGVFIGDMGDGRTQTFPTAHNLEIEVVTAI